MADTRRANGVAGHHELLSAVSAAMQRFAKTDRDRAAPASPEKKQHWRLIDGGIHCPACQQPSAKRPSYLGLELCPHCGSAMPRRRHLASLGERPRFTRSVRAVPGAEVSATLADQTPTPHRAMG
jgi:hypothetical protein